MTPSLAPAEDSASSYRFDSMGVDSLNSGGDVSVAATNTTNVAANQDIWLSWSHVSGAVKYRVYVANVQSHPAEGLVNVDHPNITDDFHSDGNENQAEDQVSNWFDTGESPIINELESTVRVQISTPNLYSGNYMGDSELLVGESVKLVVTSIDVNGYESPIGTTTPLSITDGKGPQLHTIATTNGGGTGDSERNSSTVKRGLTLTFNEPMKTTNGDDNVTLTKVGNNISSITETGAWGWTDRHTWADGDLEITFNVPTTTLSEAVYGAIARLKVASTSTFFTGDKIAIMDNASTPALQTATVADIDTENNILILTGNITPTTNSALANGANVLLYDRQG